MARDSGAIILWDLAAGRLLDLLHPNELQVAENVAFSADGKTLAVGFANGTLALWDMTTRTLQGPFQLSEGDKPFDFFGNSCASVPIPLRQSCAKGERPFDFLGNLVFSPDGRTMASHGQKTVFLWDVASRQPLDQRLTLHGDEVVSVAFSPDSTILASAGRTTLNLWDVATRQPLGRLPIDGRRWWENFSFSPDGKVLALGGCSMFAGHCRGGEVQLWDVVTRQLLGKPLRGHTSSVRGTAFSRDGKLLALSSLGRTISLWDSRQPAATRHTSRRTLSDQCCLEP